MTLFLARTSPSGSEWPIARLSLSTPFAFTDGVFTGIPLDRVDFIKGDPGRLISPPAGGVLSFALGPGLYFAQAQVEFSVLVTTLELLLGAATGSPIAHQSVFKATAGALAIGAANVSANLLIEPTETPAIPGSIFAGLGLSMTASGASGNVTKAELIVFPMYGFA